VFRSHGGNRALKRRLIRYDQMATLASKKKEKEKESNMLERLDNDD
jgi:hypothetical protein